MNYPGLVIFISVDLDPTLSNFYWKNKSFLPELNLVKTSPTSCHYHNGFSTYFSYSTRQIHLGEPFPLPTCRHETILTVYSYKLQTNFHLQTRDELHGYIFVHIDNPMKNNLYGLWCCWCCLWLWLICNDFLFYSESTENSLQSQYLHVLLSVCSGHLEEWYLLREKKIYCELFVLKWLCISIRSLHKNTISL